MLIDEYITQKRLAELGYRFDASKLMAHEADIYSTIEEIIADEEKKRPKKKVRPHRKR